MSEGEAREAPRDEAVFHALKHGTPMPDTPEAIEAARPRFEWRVSEDIAWAGEGWAVGVVNVGEIMWFKDARTAHYVASALNAFEKYVRDGGAAQSGVPQEGGTK